MIEAFIILLIFAVTFYYIDKHKDDNDGNAYNAY
jgi:hypothetical protein